jgi:uncharacterized protein YbjT (DUF2867 family)
MNVAPLSTTIVFVGATRNFFKVGHRTLHHLAQTRKASIALRLVVPDPDGAADACRGARVQRLAWEPDAEPSSAIATLADAFEGAHAILLVPPVYRRQQVTDVYLAACARARVERVVCIGVSQPHALSDAARVPLAIQAEARAVERALEASGIAQAFTLQLPMFLENLLYQACSIREQGVFRYPCFASSRFAYVACADLAPILAGLLAGTLLPDKNQKQHTVLRLSAPDTASCHELAVLLTHATGRPVRFERCTDDEFLQTLLHDGGSVATDARAAASVLDLWHTIDAGQDMVPSGRLEQLLGTTPRTLDAWVTEHACCFSQAASSSCAHPQPPRHR